MQSFFTAIIWLTTHNAQRAFEFSTFFILTLEGGDVLNAQLLNAQLYYLNWIELI